MSSIACIASSRSNRVAGLPDRGRCARNAHNHPFVDGNKRIAFAATNVFLRINGWRLQRAPLQIYAQMMQMFESGTFDIAHIDPWLRGFAEAEAGEGGDSER